MTGQIIPGANNDIFRNAPRPNVPRTAFPLSEVNTTTQDFGELKPIYYLDCIPNSNIKIELVQKIESLPMVSPLWQSIKLRTWFFFVPYAAMWKNFDLFIQGGRDGKYTAEIPYLKAESTVGTEADESLDIEGTPLLKFGYGSLVDSFNLPVDVDLAPAKINAFKAMAYQMCYKHNFLNQDVETSDNINQWFPSVESDFSLSNGGQRFIQPDPDSPKIDLLKKRYVNFDRDYFTTLMFSPQRGDPVAMPVDIRIGEDVPLDFAFSKLSDANTMDGYLYFKGRNPDDVNGNVIVTDMRSSDPSLLRSANLSRTDYNSLTDAQKKQTIPFKVNRNDLSRAIGTTQAGFLIDDLRLATQLQVWLERNMRIQANIKQFYPAHFGVSIQDGRCDGPVYIGGSMQQIQISEIIQQSESTESSPLGSSAGVAKGIQNGYIGDFFVREFGCIIGLSAIMPDTMYINQGIPRQDVKRSRYDFFFPEFANLSPQPVLSQELYYDPNDEEGNQSVMGYTDIWNEYRVTRNHVSGLFGDSNYMDFFTRTLARKFSNRPTLSPEFINSRGNIRHDIFVAGNTLPPFMVQYGLKVRAVLPLPYQSKPQGLI